MTDSHAADVQAELQNYLNTKNINALFISIVESLLIEKPANPIAFIIEYLFKQYPDQAKVALDGLLPSGGGGGGGGGGSSAVSASVPKSNMTKKAVPTALDSEDENDEEDLGDIPEGIKKPKGRRTGVSAESMDPEKLKSQMSQVANIAKSPEVAASLIRAVGKSPLLKTLDPEQKDKIVGAFGGPVSYQPGADIIVQGDIGDTFYLLEDGLVDVFVRKGGADEMKVHTYRPGDAFGELAILYNAPRAATCRAQGNVKVWTLDRVSFRVIVVAATMQKREVYKGFLQQVPLFNSMSENEIMTLADSLAEVTFQDGDVICKQGEEGDYFYIVKTGTAVCSQRNAEGKDMTVATLSAGNYFGEIALMYSKPRQATVTASGTLQCLSMDQATFTRVFGNMEEILKRNLDEYAKFTAQNI